MRINKVIHTIVSIDQSGYVKDRYIGDNIRTLADLMYYLEEQDKQGIALLIDFEKAFDSVSWNFMYKCLDKFSFGPCFKSWIKILCK